MFHAAPQSQRAAAADSLVVEDDHAELSYDGAYFRASQRRVLLNGGADPVTRYLMRISVDLVFPAALDPVVWGTETSATAEAIPLRTMPARADRDGRAVFSWAAGDPPVGARYRLEWRFRGRPDDDKEHPELRTATERMKAAGIVQDGDPVLLGQAEPFRLPDEAAEAESIIAELFSALQRADEQHVFSKGMGIAAPQIGIPRAAAIVIPPGTGAEPVVMLNPQVISESAETDEQYEGCLSFFDVRGLVPRPLHMEVACMKPDGRQYILALDTAIARLAAHEIDHLNGKLYTSRMRDGVTPIPVAEYRGTGHAWSYSAPAPSAS